MKETLEIAHLTSAHPAFDIRIFVKECRSLAREGFQVTLVAPHQNDETVDGVRIKAIPPVHGLHGLSSRTRAMGSILREALKLNADLYHFHDPELIPFELYVRQRKQKAIPTRHANDPQEALL